MSNQYVVRIVFKVNVQQNLNIDKSKISRMLQPSLQINNEKVTLASLKRMELIKEKTLSKKPS